MVVISCANTETVWLMANINKNKPKLIRRAVGFMFDTIIVAYLRFSVKLKSAASEAINGALTAAGLERNCPIELHAGHAPKNAYMIKSSAKVTQRRLIRSNALGSFEIYFIM